MKKIILLFSLGIFSTETYPSENWICHIGDYTITKKLALASGALFAIPLLRNHFYNNAQSKYLASTKDLHLAEMKRAKPETIEKLRTTADSNYNNFEETKKRLFFGSYFLEYDLINVACIIPGSALGISALYMAFIETFFNLYDRRNR